MSLAKVLGTKLQGKNGEVSVDSLNGKHVMLYFSAHWCPPCKKFTPKLGEYYKKHSAAKNFEIVFVSSDKDQAAFDEYYGEMPWLALPFPERDLKNQLSSKFKVSGIPSLCVLDPEGNLITDKGREKVSTDAECLEFPWSPKPLSEVVKGMTMIDNKGNKTTLAELQEQDMIIGLYFSAHWCPPCKGFTPELAKTYTKIKEAGKKFEIIFVSSDRDQASFDEYHGEMPWLALPFEERSLKNELSEAFDVSGIPSFHILGSDLKVINNDGRSAVSGDKDGVEFPWHPKPLNDLSAGPGAINDMPSLIAFCNVAKETQEKVVNAMSSVAQSHWDEKGQEEAKFAFFTAKSNDGIGPRVRQLLSVGDDELKIAMLDIPSGGVYYKSDMTEVTESALKAFMESYKDGTPSKLGT
jgi:nucleoredoxin